MPFLPLPRCLNRFFAGVRPVVVALGMLGTVPLLAQAQNVGNPLERLPETVAPASPPPKVSIAPAAPVSPILSQRLTPRRIDVQGVKAVPFEQVVALTKDLVGHDVSVADLVARADRITQMYHDRGYPLSLAFVPPQTFDGGVVRFVVVEGHIDRVVIDGDPGPLRDRILGILDPLTHERPLKAGVL